MCLAVCLCLSVWLLLGVSVNAVVLWIFARIGVRVSGEANEELESGIVGEACDALLVGALGARGRCRPRPHSAGGVLRATLARDCCEAHVGWRAVVGALAAVFGAIRVGAAVAAAPGVDECVTVACFTTRAPSRACAKAVFDYFLWLWIVSYR